jgi:hypothetical protein
MRLPVLELGPAQALFASYPDPCRSEAPWPHGGVAFHPSLRCRWGDHSPTEPGAALDVSTCLHCKVELSRLPWGVVAPRGRTIHSRDRERNTVTGNRQPARAISRDVPLWVTAAHRRERQPCLPRRPATTGRTATGTLHLRPSSRGRAISGSRRMLQEVIANHATPFGS